MTFFLVSNSESAPSITPYSPWDLLATIIFGICLLLVTYKQKTTYIYI